MKCPECGCEMEKGITAFTTKGFHIIRLLYTSDDELAKKGLKNFFTKERTLIELTEGKEVVSYRCENCKKLITCFDE